MLFRSFGVSSLYSPSLLLAATSALTEVLVFINENLFPESRNPKGLAAYKKAHTGHKNASTLQFQNADVFLARSSATSFIKAIETFSLPLTGSVHSMHISLALLSPLGEAITGEVLHVDAGYHVVGMVSLKNAHESGEVLAEF